MAADADTFEDGSRRFGARALLAGLALVLVAVPFGLLLFLVQEEWRPLVRLDDGARDGLNAFALENDWFVTAMDAASTVGSARVYWVAFPLLVGWLAWRRLRRLAAFVAVTMLGSAILNAAIKALVDRARPVLPDPVAHAPGWSFPSGHAQSSVVAASVVLLVFLPALRGARRTAALAAGVLWALTIGFSRVALGVHYVSDVLAGWVLGAAWVALLTAAFSAWRRERGQPPVDASEGLEPESAARLGVGKPEQEPQRAR